MLAYRRKKLRFAFGLSASKNAACSKKNQLLNILQQKKSIFVIYSDFN